MPVTPVFGTPANSAGLVYGTITVAALLSAEIARSETYVDSTGSVAIAMMLYWLAHSYSEYTGERIEQGEHFTYAGLIRTATREVTMLLGAAVPLLVLLVCWATGVGLGTALLAGIWTSVTIVIAAEVMIGLRTELSGRDLIRQTAFGVVLGLLVIALRVLLK